MKFKLVANKETVNTLKTKYKITSFLFRTYIDLNYNDISDIQKLLHKSLILNNMTNTITVLDQYIYLRHLKQ